MNYIYVSYCAADCYQADTIRDFFKDKGICLRCPAEDKTVGADLSEYIPAAVKDAKAVLLLLSDSAQKSKQVMRELFFADKYDVPIIPVKWSEFAENDKISYFICDCFPIDITSFENDYTRLDELFKEINALIHAGDKDKADMTPLERISAEREEDPSVWEEFRLPEKYARERGDGEGTRKEKLLAVLNGDEPIETDFENISALQSKISAIFMDNSFEAEPSLSTEGRAFTRLIFDVDVDDDSLGEISEEINNKLPLSSPIDIYRHGESGIIADVPKEKKHAGLKPFISDEQAGIVIGKDVNDNEVILPDSDIFIIGADENEKESFIAAAAISLCAKENRSVIALSCGENISQLNAVIGRTDITDENIKAAADFLQGGVAEGKFGEAKPAVIIDRTLNPADISPILDMESRAESGIICIVFENEEYNENCNRLIFKGGSECYDGGDYSSDANHLTGDGDAILSTPDYAVRVLIPSVSDEELTQAINVLNEYPAPDMQVVFPAGEEAAEEAAAEEEQPIEEAEPAPIEEAEESESAPLPSPWIKYGEAPASTDEVLEEPEEVKAEAPIEEQPEEEISAEETEEFPAEESEAAEFEEDIEITEPQMVEDEYEAEPDDEPIQEETAETTNEEPVPEEIIDETAPEAETPIEEQPEEAPAEEPAAENVVTEQLSINCEYSEDSSEVYYDENDCGASEYDIQISLDGEEPEEKAPEEDDESEPEEEAPAEDNEPAPLPSPWREGVADISATDEEAIEPEEQAYAEAEPEESPIVILNEENNISVEYEEGQPEEPEEIPADENESEPEEETEEESPAEESEATESEEEPEAAEFGEDIEITEPQVFEDEYEAETDEEPIQEETAEATDEEPIQEENAEATDEEPIQEENAEATDEEPVPEEIIDETAPEAEAEEETEVETPIEDEAAEEYGEYTAESEEAIPTEEPEEETSTEEYTVEYEEAAPIEDEAIPEVTNDEPVPEEETEPEGSPSVILSEAKNLYSAAEEPTPEATEPEEAFEAANDEPVLEEEPEATETEAPAEEEPEATEEEPASLSPWEEGEADISATDEGAIELEEQAYAEEQPAEEEAPTEEPVPESENDESTIEITEPQATEPQATENTEEYEEADEEPAPKVKEPIIPDARHIEALKLFITKKQASINILQRRPLYMNYANAISVFEWALDCGYISEPNSFGISEVYITMEEFHSIFG